MIETNLNSKAAWTQFTRYIYFIAVYWDRCFYDEEEVTQAFGLVDAMSPEHARMQAEVRIVNRFPRGWLSEEFFDGDDLDGNDDDPEDRPETYNEAKCLLEENGHVTLSRIEIIPLPRLLCGPPGTRRYDGEVLDGLLSSESAAGWSPRVEPDAGQGLREIRSEAAPWASSTGASGPAGMSRAKWPLLRRAMATVGIGQDKAPSPEHLAARAAYLRVCRSEDRLRQRASQRGDQPAPRRAPRARARRRATTRRRTRAPAAAGDGDGPEPAPRAPAGARSARRAS